MRQNSYLLPLVRFHRIFLRHLRTSSREICKQKHKVIIFILGAYLVATCGLDKQLHCLSCEGRRQKAEEKEAEA